MWDHPFHIRSVSFSDQHWTLYALTKPTLQCIGNGVWWINHSGKMCICVFVKCHLQSDLKVRWIKLSGKMCVGKSSVCLLDVMRWATCVSDEMHIAVQCLLWNYENAVCWMYSMLYKVKCVIELSRRTQLLISVFVSVFISVFVYCICICICVL